MTDILIEDYIPAGYDNRISRSELCNRCGLLDRDARKGIEDARARGVLIISYGGGYFRYKDEADDAYARAYILGEEHRAKTINRHNAQLRRVWRKIKPQEDRSQVPGQMSFV